jgi:hypothetical protein
MLSRSDLDRIDRLLSVFQQGVITREEFGLQIANLVTAEDQTVVLQKLPAELVEPSKDGFALGRHAAADREYLEPEDSPFGQHSAYYENVGLLLLKPEANRKPRLLSVVCLPSFEAEWALELFGSSATGYGVVMRVAEERIWTSRAPSAINVRRSEGRLPSGVAERACAVWRSMLQRTRFPEVGICGLDGVTYHFQCHLRGAGRMAGKVWSPDRNTGPGRLVALSHALVNYAKADESAREAALAEIDEYLQWFEGRADILRT